MELLIAPFVELKSLIKKLANELAKAFNRTICGIEIYFGLGRNFIYYSFNRTICGIEIENRTLHKAVISRF